MARLTVVGGGPAGISAAFRAARRGFEVTILERLSHLGGRLRSRRVAAFGFPVDNGPHALMFCCTRTRAMLRDMGMADLVEWQDRFKITFIERGGSRSELKSGWGLGPLHLGSSFMRLPWLRITQKTRIARTIGNLWAQADLEDDHQRSFGTWLISQGQDRQSITHFWNPLVVASLNASVDAVSLGAAAFFFRRAMLSSRDSPRFGFFKEGLGEIFDTRTRTLLEGEGVEVLTGTKVTRLSPGTLHLDDGSELESKRTILALPHDKTARLLGINIPLEFRPISTFHLLYDRKVIDAPLVGILKSDLQWFYDAGRSTGQPGLLQIIMSDHDGYSHLTDDRLSQLVGSEAAEYLPEAQDATLAGFAVTREPRATFLAAPGYDKAFIGARSLANGVIIAGAWNEGRWPSTIEAAVRSGERAARSALEIR